MIVILNGFIVDGKEALPRLFRPQCAVFPLIQYRGIEDTYGDNHGEPHEGPELAVEE